jgi:hypothetical protein
MFGSNLLDVAIGMIFVYLLLSLICSAAHEIIEGWMKNRATDLERGIRELLDPNSTISTTGLVDDIYKHPLVNGLYKGTYEQFANHRNKFFLFRWLIRLFTTWPKLPTYIPARNFALALMDTVLPATPEGVASGAAGATPASAPAAPLVSVAPAGAAPAPSPSESNPIERLRNAIGEIPIEPTRKALLTIVDAAGNDVSKARENIEAWFNSSMDRVSGWYKRRSQIVILILGFGIAVALNADSVTLVKRLWTDKTLRDSLVAAAETYAKENPSPTPAATGSPTAATATTTTAATSGTSAPAAVQPIPSPSPKASPSPSPSPATTSAASPSPAGGATTPSASPSPTPTPLPECVKDENSPECKFAKNQQAIKKLGLPIGWVHPEDDPTVELPRRWPGTNWAGEGGWLSQIYWHFLGWLITAMAVSLGAPFWFDLLNKFIVVRSTVKPHEKSPEERSKA